MTKPLRAGSPPEQLPLYPSEEQIVGALYGSNAPAEMQKGWTGVAAVLERDGFPKRDPLFGNRRYWPSVAAWLRRRNGLASDSGGYAPDGKEDFS